MPRLHEPKSQSALCNSVLLLPLLHSSHPAARSGVPFLVLACTSFGIRGAHVPALLRTFAAWGWFGIETWTGGQAIYILPSFLFHRIELCSHYPMACNVPTRAFLLRALLDGANACSFERDARDIRELEKYSALILVVLVSFLLDWAYVKAKGFGPMLSLPQPSRLSHSELWALFVPSITASTGSWAGVALSIPGFARLRQEPEGSLAGRGASDCDAKVRAKSNVDPRSSLLHPLLVTVE